MSKAVSFRLKENTLEKGLKKWAKNNPVVFKKGQNAMALQLLNNVVNGSPQESVTPPIRTGFLRGSGSAFVGGELVGTTKDQYPKGQPNTDYSAKPEVITVGFDASYAVFMHEKDWSPGSFSQQAGDTGNKFLERHLKADGKELFELLASILKKDLNSGGI